MRVLTTNESSDGIALNEEGKANGKRILLAQAELLYHDENILLEDRYYLSLKRRLKGIAEPHLETGDLYDLDSAETFVSVNFYNCVVLNSRNMVIVDVDFEDNRCTSGVFVHSVADVVRSLGNLEIVDRHVDLSSGIEPLLSWADKSFRVYRTRNGCRVICTSMAARWDDDHVLPLMRFLGADENYVRLCEEQRTFRARLTPKPWSANGGAPHVCQLVYQHGYDIVAPELKEQLRLHDELVLPTAAAEDLYLA